tara:strand:- start:43 stop:537 length:495 start_codon:yes stop_codon:yes gene_type:complete
MGTTTFTGPIQAGNVLQSDGTGNLAGVGGYNGTANVGYCVMAQSEVVTQATNGSSPGVYTTNIVIPAQSQILRVNFMVTTIWSGVASTAGLGSTASATAFTPAGDLTLGSKGFLTGIAPTTDGQIATWDNVGDTDVQVVLTSTNTGTGVGTMTVEYIQSINLAS